jgi:hypothetical protein
MGHIPVAKRFLKVRSYSLEKLGETIVNFWPFGVSAWYPMKFHFGAGDILMWIFYLISLLSFFLRSPYLFFTSFIFSGFTLASCGILLLQTLSEPPLPASATCQNQASRAFVKTWLYSTAHMRVHAAVSNWNAGKCQANESANSTQKTSTWAREQTAYSLSFRKSGPKAIKYNYIYNTGYPFPMKHCENPHRQFSKTSAFLLERSSRSILWSGRGACIPSVHTDCTSWFGHWGFYVPAARTTSGVVHGQTITRQCHYVAQQSPNRSWDSRHGLTNKVLCQHQARDCLRLTSHFDMFSHS